VTPLIPLCWPLAGQCGCGRGHVGKEVGKAPLVSYRDTPPTYSRIEHWRRAWPRANWGRLLEPEHLLVIDLDSSDAHLVFDVVLDERGRPRAQKIRRLSFGERLRLRLKGYATRAPAGVHIASES
jgi:hypothetical protein